MRSYRYRSLFWPGVLVLAGVIALLVNTGQISVERLGLLFALWPLVLIVLGLEIMVRGLIRARSGEVAAAAIVIVALAGAALYVAAAPNPGGTHTLDVTSHDTSVQEATLDVNVGAATIDLSYDPESNDLYRAHVEYTGQQPRVDFDRSSRTLRIDQHDSGFNFFQNRQFALTLQVSQSVRWAIVQNSGAATITDHLAQLHVTSLRLNTGASKDDITLGTPDGSVPVEINGGSLTVHIHRPRTVTNIRIDVSGGAISLNADGQSSHGFGHLGAGAHGFGDGYEVKVNGGACTVTLDTTPPPPQARRDSRASNRAW